MYSYILFAILAFFMQCFAPAAAEDMLLGRIADNSHSYFTLLGLLRTFIFAGLLTALIGIKYYDTLQKKIFLASLLIYTLFVLVTPSVGTILSIIDFSYFPAFSVVLGFTFLSLAAYAVVLSLPSKDFLQDNKILIIGSVSAAAIILLLLSVMVTPTAIYLLTSLWALGAIGVSLYLIYQIIQNEDDILIETAFTGILWGSLLSFGTGGGEDIVGISLRLLGWIGCYAGLMQITFIAFYKKKISVPKFSFVNQADIVGSQSDGNFSPTAQHIPAPTMSGASDGLMPDLSQHPYWIEYNSQLEQILLSEPLLDRLGLSKIRKNYSLKHFKSLILRDDQDIFEMALKHPNDKRNQTFSFYGIEHPFNLHRVYHEEYNLKTFYFSLSEALADQQNENGQPITSISGVSSQSSQYRNGGGQVPNALSSRPAHQYKLNDVIDEFKKEAFNMRNKDGFMCILIVNITNYDVLVYEAGVKNSLKIIESILSKLNQSLIIFDHLVMQLLSPNQIAFFFHSATNMGQIEKAKNIITQTLNTPTQCVLGNFFSHFSFGHSFEQTEKILYDSSLKLIDNLLENAYQDLMNKNADQFSSIIQQNLSFPKGTTISGLAADLRYAPEKHQIEPYFQPVLDAKNKNIIGCDTVITWLHPDYGVMDDHITRALADYTHYHATLERITILKSLERLKYWQELLQNKNLFTIVHISQETFENLGPTISDVVMLIKKLQLSPKSLHICLSDHCLRNSDHFMEMTKMLKRNGFTILLDNFARNVAGLPSVVKYPIDHVVFDSQYGLEGIKNERSFYAFSSTLKTIKNMNIKVAISGIDEAKIIPLLHKMGIDYVLGKACGDSLSASGMTSFFKKYMQDYQISL